MTHSIDPSQRAAARLLGFAYLPAFVLVVAVNFGVLEPLVGVADPAQVARNILAHPTAFRVGVTGFLLYCVATLVVSAATYVVLKPVDAGLALVAMLGRVAHGGTWLLVTMNLFTAQRLLSRPEFAVLPPDHLPVLARLYLSSFIPYYVGLVFWSLAATIAAYLWLRSGYVPRALAWFGLVSSAWCVLCTFALLIFPGFSKIVNLWLFDSAMALFEIGVSLLLLIRGLPAGGPAQERS